MRYPNTSIKLASFNPKHRSQLRLADAHFTLCTSNLFASLQIYKYNLSTTSSRFFKTQYLPITQGKRVFIKDITYYLVPPGQQESHIAPSLQNIKRGVGTEEQLNKQGGLGLGIASASPDSSVATTNADKAPSLKSPPVPYSTPTEDHNPPVVPRAILERFHFTFLIRHPNRAVPSYYRCCIPPLVERTGFNPWMASEAGYDELRALFDYCPNSGLIGPKVCGRDDAPKETATGNSGSDSNIEICVIDADDLLDDPEGVLRKYCSSIGLSFSPKMLNWDNEEDHQFAKQEFEKWNGFHDDAIHSKDLKPRVHVSLPSDQ